MELSENIQKRIDNLPNQMLDTALDHVEEYLSQGDWFYPEDFMEDIVEEVNKAIATEVKQLCERPEFKQKLKLIAEQKLGDIIADQIDL